MKLRNIRLESESEVVYAELYYDDGTLAVDSTLSYILNMAVKRGYVIEGLAEKPVFTRKGFKIWVCIGNGRYESFDNLREVIDYVNLHQVGKVTHWGMDWFATANFHGQNVIHIWHSCSPGRKPLDDDEKAALKAGLHVA